MKILITTLLLFSSFTAMAKLPPKHTSLLPYVQPGPDQGETTTCLFMASTGAIELLANRRNGITHPKVNGPFDLSEPWLINQEEAVLQDKYFVEYPVHVFNNTGFGVLNSEWPFNAWIEKDVIDWSAWQFKDSSKMKKVAVPKVKTEEIFIAGGKHATEVIGMEEVIKVKEALVKHNSPIIINYVDDFYWHVILIVGYDDNAKGICYEIDKKECAQTKGSFYVRDSDGLGTQLRDYDWFIHKANAAFVVRETDPLPVSKKSPKKFKKKKGNYPGP